MLITEELNIKINHRTKNYYMSKGYDVNHEIIPIKIKDLPKNSGQKIKCSCDDCGKILEMTFQNYNKGIDKNKKTICKTCIKKYFINPFSDKDVKEKIKKTLLKKYGVDNPLKNKNIIQKRNDTMIKKYGCSYSFNNEIIDKKRINKIKNRTTEEDDYEIGYFNDDYDIVAKVPFKESFKIKVKIRSISRLQPKVFIIR